MLWGIKMATYYTFDSAVEEFIHWHDKCKHYGIDPKDVIAEAKKEHTWIYEDLEGAKKTDQK